MSGSPIVPDGNRLVVFGSQLIGVVIVIVGLLTQQGELHSLRPTGTKNQVAGKWQPKAERFARLWDDPLEDMPAFQVVSNKQSNSAEETSHRQPIARSTLASRITSFGNANTGAGSKLHLSVEYPRRAAIARSKGTQTPHPLRRRVCDPGRRISAPARIGPRLVVRR